MKKRALSIIAVLALLIAALAVTAMAAETPVAPNDASAYAKAEMKGKFGPEYPVTQYCPVCNAEKKWYPLDKGMTGTGVIDYNHYYLLANITHTGSGFYRIPSGKTVCMYMNGYNISNEAYIAVQVSGGTFNLIGNGTETVSGGGLNSAVYGAAFDIRGGALNLYGVNVTKTPGTTRSGPTIGMNEAAGTLNVYNGTTISGGTNSGNGGNIGMYYEGCTVNIHGGTVTGGTAAHGGNIFASGASHTLNISGGTVTGGTTTSGNGGNISFSGKSTLNLSGGTVSNGTAANWGGNLYSDSYTNLNITGGTITGGSAKNGGNIGMEHSYLNFQGGSVTDGSAANGGNLYLSNNATRYGKVNINNNDGGSAPTVSGGTATSVGGNIYLNVYSGKSVTISDLTTTGGTAANGGNLALYGAGSLTMEKVTVTGGTASASGGAAYVSSPSLTLNNCTVSGGVVTGTGSWNIGGNFYVDGDTGVITVGEGTTVSGGKAQIGGNFAAHAEGTVSIQGGTVKDGIAAGGGTNIYTTSSGVLTADGATIENKDSGINCHLNGTATLTDTSISGGSYNIYNAGTLSLTDCTLDGSVLSDNNTVFDGTAAKVVTVRGGQVTLAGTANLNNLDVVGAETKLQVATDFDGQVTLYGLGTKPEARPFGDMLDGKYTAAGDFTGKLILNFVGDKPWAFHENGGLVVGNARTQKDKEITWHKNNAMAAQNYNDADLLIPGNHELPLAGGNYVVNVAGIKDLNVTGTGSVTFYDTANKNFKDYGSVTVADTVTVANEFATQVEADGGNTYFMLETDGALSFHRMDMKVDGVSIRPSTAGIYYTSVWHCDDLLKDKIMDFGVAVSLADQPGTDYRRDKQNLYTAFDKNAFENGKSMTSVLINNILEADNAENAARGEAAIYATAYMTIDDGSDGGYTMVDGEEVRYSLKQVMQLIDGSQKVYLENKQTVDSFYSKWESVMGAWGLTNITGTTASPAADDTLNILMIGNSYCYYYVQELYDLLASDGTQANVYNLYKSGCTMKEHYDWWMDETAGYQFFWKTNSDGYNKVKGGATMAEALLAENWDVISIQESLFKNIASATTDDLLAQNEVYREKLIPMLKNAFPNAQIYWHQQWGPEAGFTITSGGELIEVPDADAQLAYAVKEREAAQRISEKYEIGIVNTGDAWQTIRTTPEYAAMLPTGGLCARIGENNFAGTDGGDGYHDGDIGGGQYLNACVWYETLTGKSCVGKTFEVKTFHNAKDEAYAPQYTLAPEFVTVLQNVAHETVAKTATK